MSEHSPTPWKHSDTEHAAIQDANWMTDGIFAGEELSDVEVHDRIIGRIDAALARAKGEGHE